MKCLFILAFLRFSHKISIIVIFWTSKGNNFWKIGNPLCTPKGNFNSHNYNQGLYTGHATSMLTTCLIHGCKVKLLDNIYSAKYLGIYFWLCIAVCLWLEEKSELNYPTVKCIVHFQPCLCHTKHILCTGEHMLKHCITKRETEWYRGIH